MKKYDYYTFDLWLTLIKSNKEFKEKRNKLIFDKFDEGIWNESIITKAINYADKYYNSLSEKSGIHINSKIILTTIAEEIGYKSKKLWEEVIELDSEIQKLFIENPPVLYDENTWKTLENLRYNSKKMGIISNTGFIHGNTIREVLGKLKIKKFFDVMVFSDECGYSKPNSKIFETALYSLYPRKHDILHVGDNIIADGGCTHKSLKWDYFQINSNDKTIIDLL